MPTSKIDPKDFSKKLRDELRRGGTPSPMALIPKNKRPFYESVVIDFETIGRCRSPSGMTASIVACYLKSQRKSFVIVYDAEDGVFTVVKN